MPGPRLLVPVHPGRRAEKAGSGSGGERRGMIARSAGPGVGRAGKSALGLPPIPTIHPGAPPIRAGPTLSNGAALYRDSAIPWEIEAVAREAMGESLG